MAQEDSLNKYLTTVDSGKIIFKEGDFGSHFYIIRSGRIKISKQLDGKELVLTLLEKGDFFGEMALVSKIRRSATATAASTTQLLSFTKKGFTEMVQKNGTIALSIISQLCKRLQNTNQQLKLVAEKDSMGLFSQTLYYALRSEDSVENSINYLDFYRETSLALGIPQQKISYFLDMHKTLETISILNAKITLLDERKLMGLAKITKQL